MAKKAKGKDVDWPLLIVLVVNFVLCCIAKVLTFQQNGYGPFILVCALIFPFAYRGRLWAEIIYHLLALLALVFAAYGGMVLFLIFVRNDLARAHLTALCIIYLLMLVAHVTGCVLIIRRRWKKRR